jgi:hypothetical protein
MKNAIISELRRLRDARSREHNLDIESKARDLMKLEPWMAKKTFVMKRGRMIPLASARGGKSSRQPVRTSG